MLPSGQRLRADDIHPRLRLDRLDHAGNIASRRKHFHAERQRRNAVGRNTLMDCQDIRRTGSAALDLAHIACGRIEGYLEKKLKIWDFAAGALIVREADGCVLDYEGNDRTMEPIGDVIAGNGSVAKILARDYIK